MSCIVIRAIVVSMPAMIVSKRIVTESSSLNVFRLVLSVSDQLCSVDWICRFDLELVVIYLSILVESQWTVAEFKVRFGHVES